ncbi:hypothetical protein T265_15932, partial [Opisthorchis viverrini]
MFTFFLLALLTVSCRAKLFQMTRFNSTVVTVTQRMSDADKYDEQPLCAQLITKHIGVWAKSEKLSKCVLRQVQNGYPIFHVNLNATRIPEGYQEKANLF